MYLITHWAYIMKTKLSLVWFGRDCGWRREREKDHGERGREGWRKTNNQRCCSQWGQKVWMEAAFQRLFKGWVPPAPLEKQTGVVDCFWVWAAVTFLPVHEAPQARSFGRLRILTLHLLKAHFLSDLQLPSGQKRIPGPCCIWAPLFFRERE